MVRPGLPRLEPAVLRLVCLVPYQLRSQGRRLKKKIQTKPHDQTLDSGSLRSKWVLAQEYTLVPVEEFGKPMRGARVVKHGFQDSGGSTFKFQKCINATDVTMRVAGLTLGALINLTI